MVARSRTAAAFAVAGMGSGRVAAPHSPAAAVVAGMVGRVVVGARASSELASVEPIAALLAALAVVAFGVVAFAVRVSFFLQKRVMVRQLGHPTGLSKWNIVGCVSEKAWDFLTKCHKSRNLSHHRSQFLMALIVRPCKGFSLAGGQHRQLFHNPVT